MAGSGAGARVERVFFSVALLAALATVLLLQSTRVFVAYLVFVIDQSNRETLAGAALLTFAAVGAGGPLAILLGRQRAVAVATGVLLLARLVLQLVDVPEARVVLGALGIAAGGWLLIALLALRRDGVAFGVPLGLAIDLIIRIAFHTVDLPWMPDLPKLLVTLMLLFVAGLSALVVVRLSPGLERPGGGIGLLALGPGLAIHHLMTGNLASARYELDLSLPGAALVLTLGTLLGLALLPFVSAVDAPAAAANRSSRLLPLAGLALLLVAAVLLFWQRPALNSPALVAGVAGTILLLALALGAAPRRESTARVAGWLTGGMLLQAVLLFAYYNTSGDQRIAVVTWALFAGAALAGSRGDAPADVAPRRLASRLVGIGAMALLVVAFVAATSDTPEGGPPLGGELRVMTYNIQSGFSRENDWDLEATAQTIEAANADIVLLQEVSRGWLVTSTVDEIDWLARRLDMEYAFGPNVEDGLWGNAILSRVPIEEVERHRFTTTDNLDRGVVIARIATETGAGLWVLATHLDNPKGSGEVRLRQVNELLAYWDGRAPAILGGDLNADPETDVLARLAEAGFSDPGIQLLSGVTTSEDDRRIDYLLLTEELTATAMEAPPVWTSDHRPVIATITRGPE